MYKRIKFWIKICYIDTNNQKSFYDKTNSIKDAIKIIEDAKEQFPTIKFYPIVYYE